MIPVETAALLAQIYPVGIVVLGLELRTVQDLYPTTRSAWLFLGSMAVGLVAAVVGGLSSISTCIYAISDGLPISGGEAVVVSASGSFLSAGVGILLVLAIMDRFGLVDAIARKKDDDPERVLELIEAVNMYAPSASSLSPEALENLREAARAHAEEERAAGRRPKHSGP